MAEQMNRDQLFANAAAAALQGKTYSIIIDDTLPPRLIWLAYHASAYVPGFALRLMVAVEDRILTDVVTDKILVRVLKGVVLPCVAPDRTGVINAINLVVKNLESQDPSLIRRATIRRATRVAGRSQNRAGQRAINDPSNMPMYLAASCARYSVDRAARSASSAADYAIACYARAMQTDKSMYDTMKNHARQQIADIIIEEIEKCPRTTPTTSRPL